MSTASVPGGEEAVRTVGAYLEAMAAHEWETLGDLLSPSVVRVGPFGDRYSPKEPYVAFLRDLLPSLAGYQLVVKAIRAFSGTGALAELSETVEMEGRPVVTHEALVFTLDDQGLISRIEIFIQRSGDPD